MAKRIDRKKLSSETFNRCYSGKRRNQSVVMPHNVNLQFDVVKHNYWLIGLNISFLFIYGNTIECWTRWNPADFSFAKCRQVFYRPLILTLWFFTAMGILAASF